MPFISISSLGTRVIRECCSVLFPKPASNRFAMASSVLGLRFGNHVGDWEHTMVRFIDGVPDTVYYSEHSSGAAYKYSAVEKIGDRPVSYTATGTHANYAVCASICLNGRDTVSSSVMGVSRHQAIMIIVYR